MNENRMTMEQAVNYLGMDCAVKSFASRYVYGKHPRIVSYKMGNNRYIDKEDLDAFIKRSKTKTRRQYLNTVIR